MSTDYETERLANISANAALLSSLGLGSSTSNPISFRPKPKPKLKAVPVSRSSVPGSGTSVGAGLGERDGVGEGTGVGTGLGSESPERRGRGRPRGSTKEKWIVAAEGQVRRSRRVADRADRDLGSASPSTPTRSRRVFRALETSPTPPPRIHRPPAAPRLPLPALTDLSTSLGPVDESGISPVLRPRPTRGEDGRWLFEEPWTGVFVPNISPEEMFKSGAFAGGFFAETYSTVLGQRLPSSDATAIHPSTPFTPSQTSLLLTSLDPDPGINRFSVRAGQSLAQWEKSGWIWAQDPRGWAQWYTRFWNGRRCVDDERQVRRWLNVAGPTGRFKAALSKQIAVAASSKYAHIQLTQSIEGGGGGGGGGGRGKRKSTEQSHGRKRRRGVDEDEVEDEDTRGEQGEQGGGGGGEGGEEGETSVSVHPSIRAAIKDEDVGRVVRQTLWQWGYELNEREWARAEVAGR